MLIILIAVTVGGWLALWAVLAVRTASKSARTAAQAAPQPTGSEPPAVVSVLAGRLESAGYPATLLDLAARGWFRLEATAGGPVMCVLGPDRPSGELTTYERLAYANLVTRAGGRPDVPAAALSDGFAGPDTASAAKSTKDAFMEAFTTEVIEDSRRRGLTHPRLSEGSGCLLWVAAAVPAILSGLALRSHGSLAYWIPIAGFVAACTVSGIAVKAEKPTAAGRAALRAWRGRCSRSGAGKGAARAAPLPPGWPRREDAYSAALGGQRAAVELFSDTRREPPGKATWSSYGGHWRQVTIGEPRPRGLIENGGVLLPITALILTALLPPAIATAILAHGELRTLAFAAMSLDAVIAARLLTRQARIPTMAEFDGRVIEAWIETESGENSDRTYPCLAIDDGVSDRAWAFRVPGETYRMFVPGTLVHVQVNPRHNHLLEIRHR